MLPVGAMAVGKLKIIGKLYYFYETGVRAESTWIELSGKTYYCQEDGRMATGTVTIDGVTYTFDSNGVLIS